MTQPNIYSLLFRSRLRVVLTVLPLQMGGGKDFRIFDSGSRDKMLLRLSLQADKMYTIREHAVKHISRGIGVDKAIPGRLHAVSLTRLWCAMTLQEDQEAGTIMEMKQNEVEQDVTMAFAFRVEQQMEDKARDSVFLHAPTCTRTICIQQPPMRLPPHTYPLNMLLPRSSWHSTALSSRSVIKPTGSG